MRVPGSARIGSVPRTRDRHGKYQAPPPTGARRVAQRTLGEAFSAHRCKDIRERLSQVTLAERGRVLDRLEREHPKELRCVSCYLGL
jgi:hypothetical protein